MSEAPYPDTRFLGLGRNVLILGLVSLLNDAASEMIYPLLPLFLTAVLGAGPEETVLCQLVLRRILSRSTAALKRA